MAWAPFVGRGVLGYRHESALGADSRARARTHTHTHTHIHTHTHTHPRPPPTHPRTHPPTHARTLVPRGEAELSGPFAKYLVLGLGLLFLGKQETVEATVEVAKTLGERISK